MNTLHELLANTPGKGRCSHGKGAHEVLRGYDAEAGEWRTAKKNTYSPALNGAIAAATAHAIHQMWSAADSADLPEEMDDLSDLTDSLMAFYVHWDPYMGTDESWAPDYVPQNQQRARADREPDRFRPAPEASASQTADDPTASPRPTGPPEANEEQ